MSSDGSTSQPTPEAQATKPSTRSKAVAGAAWSVAGQFLSQGFRLITTPVLSHLVPQAAFATMQLVGTLNQALNNFSDIGVGTSIIRRKIEPDALYLRTAWTMQVVRGVVLSLIGMMLSVPLAMLYADQANSWQSLLPVFLASTAVTVLTSFASVNIFVAARELNLKLSTIFDLITQVAGLVLTVLLAWRTGSVWALVLGNVATSTARLVLSFTMFSGPSMQCTSDPEFRKEMLGFGRWVLASTILTFAAAQADKFIFPKLVNDLAVTSIYGIALTFALVPQDLVNRIAGMVLMPALSRARELHEVPAKQYHDAMTVILLVSGLACAGLSACVPGYVQATFDERYHSITQLMPFVAFGAWVRVLQTNGGYVLLAVDRPKGFAASNLVKFVLVAVCMPVGFKLMHDPVHPMPGMIGAVIGTLVADIAKHAVILYELRKAGLHGVRREVSYTVYLLAAIFAGLGVHWWCEKEGWHPVVEILISGACVVTIYIPGFARVWRLVGPHLPYFKKFAQKPRETK